MEGCPRMLRGVDTDRIGKTDPASPHGNGDTAVNSRRQTFRLRMNPVLPHGSPLRGDAFEQKRKQRQIMLRRQVIVPGCGKIVLAL